MLRGSYNGRRVDFSSYAVPCFTPHLFCGAFRRSRGCGAAALALLTGVPPEVCAERNRFRAHYSDTFMTRFLRGRLFRVQRLTLCNLSQAKSDIDQNHVLLISQLVMRNTGTWGVLHDGLYYHGFQTYWADALSCINKPLLSAYLVAAPSLRLPLGEQEIHNKSKKVTYGRSK